MLSICAATTQYQLSPFSPMKSFLLPSTPILPFPVVWHLRWYTLWRCLCRQFSMDMLLFDCTLLYQRSAVWIYLCLMAQFCINTGIMETWLMAHFCVNTGIVGKLIHCTLLHQHRHYGKVDLWHTCIMESWFMAHFCINAGSMECWLMARLCVNTDIMGKLTYGALLRQHMHYGKLIYGTLLYWCRHYGMLIDGTLLSRRRHCRKVD